MKLNVIFESPKKRDFFIIKKYLKQGIPVCIVEPFYAFHHNNGVRFVPPQIPEFADALLKKGEINLLKASQLNAREIYQLSADKAVEVVKSVFPEYRKGNAEFFEYVSDVLKSPAAENVFKKNLCERLAEFYSVNILLHRVEMFFNPGPVLFYPETNVRSYLYLKDLLSKNNIDVFAHQSIRFPDRAYIDASIENLKNYLVATARLAAQTAASGIMSVFPSYRKKNRKSYFCGMTVVSPARQLSDNRRGPNFLIDNDKIHQEEFVYFPLTELASEQKNQFKKIPGTVYYLPKAGRCFSHFSEWGKLFRLAIKKDFFLKSEEINIACNVFFHYFRWTEVLKNIEFRHFITHCDFGVSHIARNIALNQAGVQTWYFTDSMNHGCNLRNGENNNGVKHPFWTYLYYDHFVTWDELLAGYFKEHPGSFRQAHVVGCLWSGHINKEKDRSAGNAGNAKNFKDSFVLAAFDTTYTRNGPTSYTEGLAFAEHLLKLADNHPDIFIFLKEKKQRNIHIQLDPILGPKLLNLYKKMDGHPRITTYSDREDASELISISDIVVSFPFTSTTFEAISASKPAIWHDPLGYYMNTPYAEAGGITTHSYEELKSKVTEIKAMKPGEYQKPILLSSPLMDPFCDDTAIERFRELLCSHERNAKHSVTPVYTY